MNNLKKTQVYLILIALFVAILSGCKKEDDNNPKGTTPPVFNPNLTYGIMTDQEGNEYKTIVIGTQTWMAENLRVTKYRNGDPIPNIIDNAAWPDLTTGAYCSYANTTKIDEITTYGRLYNWYAVSDSRNIAPTGWHVPSDIEWITLTTYLLGESEAGNKMKETGTTHWSSPNTSATNESGFTAIPCGYRGYGDVPFFGLGLESNYWSSTGNGANSAWATSLYSNNTSFFHSGFGTVAGFSVRCVRD
jgi:uncharacterized protein (TIGR02145 family)